MKQLFTPPAEPEPVKPDETIEIKGHARKKRGRKPLPEKLPRIDILHDIPDEEKQCACGAQKSRIGEDTCENLDYIPAKVQVIRHIRPKYACKQCEGVEDDGPTVAIDPAPVQLIPKSIATEGLLAHIAVSKFADGLPLYRQQKIFGRLDVDLSRATMANWMIQAAGCCQPILELLHWEIRSGPVINIDESPFQVLNEPGRNNTSKSYMWVFCGGPFLHRLFCINTIPREVERWFRIFSKTTWAMFKVTAQESPWEKERLPRTCRRGPGLYR
jgi:transposase